MIQVVFQVFQAFWGKFLGFPKPINTLETLETVFWGGGGENCFKCFETLETVVWGGGGGRKSVSSVLMGWGKSLGFPKLIKTLENCFKCFETLSSVLKHLKEFSGGQKTVSSVSKVFQNT